MLYLHLALDLFHQVPVRIGVQVLERGTLLYRVLVLGKVQEQVPDDDVPNHSNGGPGSLQVWH